MEEPVALVTLAVLLITSGFTALSFKRPDLDLQEKFVFCPRRILAEKEVHRLLSLSLLHADWWHLGVNMLTLYLFGSLIEQIHGPGAFLAIYIGGILGGSLLSLLLHRHHPYTAYGASGGVCGVIFASIFLLPGGSIHLFPIPLPIPGWLYAILFLAGSFYALKNRDDGIGHDAHLGGAISGLLTATALYPWIPSVSPFLYTVTLAISIGLMVYLVRNPLFLPLKTFFSARGRQPKHRRPRPDLPKYKRDERETDRILEKVALHGLDSLTARERRHLDATSELHQRRREKETPTEF